MHTANNSYIEILKQSLTKKIELLEIDLDDVLRVVTAVYRPEGIAEKWAAEKNANLDFYGNRWWVVVK